MAQSIPSAPIPHLKGICRAFLILFWKTCKDPTVGPNIHTKTPRWGLKGANAPPWDNTKIAFSSK